MLLVWSSDFLRFAFMNVANLICLELGLWIYEDIIKIILLIIMFKRLAIKLACHLLGLKVLNNNDLREVFLSI